MARKTNYSVNGKDYFRIKRKVGQKLNDNGILVDVYKQFYGNSKKEAEQKYADYMKQISSGSASDRVALQVIDEWIDTIFMSSSLAAKSKLLYVSSYRNTFRKNPVACKPLTEITALDLQTFFNESTGAYSTLRSVLYLLRHFYKYAELNQFCHDITSPVTVPKPARKNNSAIKEIKVWNNDDLKAVISALDGTTLKFLVILAVNTGMRIGEILALTYDDIADNQVTINKQLIETYNNGKINLQISDTKTICSNRIVPLAPQVIAELEKHKAIHKAEMKKNMYITNNIFTTSTGNLHYKRDVTRSLQRLYKRIGVSYIKFHGYRDTFATNLSKAGVPIEEVSALLGHSDISITAKYYVSIDAQRKRNAVEKIVACSL